MIRMLRDFLGSKGFTSGLQLYLKKFAYGSAVSDDLWACMTQVRYRDESLIQYRGN